MSETPESRDSSPVKSRCAGQRNEGRALKKIAVLITVLATLGLTACESGPTEEEKEAAAKEQTEAKQLDKQANTAATIATSCRQDLGGLLRALQNTDSRLTVGLSFDDYSNQVGQISVAYDRIPLGRIHPRCVSGPGVKAEKAFNSYTEAYNEWNDCIGDLYCDMDSIDSSLQDSWAKATRQLNKARSSLVDLEVKAVNARDKADAQQKKADQAKAELES